MRIGHGFDAHQFKKGRKLILGGVEIPYDKGMEGHSDGDVALHALCDALLGAAALGDLGKYFPNTPEFKNIDSRILLRKVVHLIKERNYQISNVDITLVAQQPQLAPFIEAMRNNLTEDLKITSQQVSIKATTTDGMGFTGRNEGIVSYAVVLINDLPK